MDEEARAQAVSRKYGIPYASFDNRILKMQRGVNLETIIPASFAKELAAFFLRKERPRDGSSRP